MVVAGLDQHSDPGGGAVGVVQDSHLVVVQAHVVDLGEGGGKRLAQRRVECVDRTIALSGSVHDLVPHSHLDGGLADQRMRLALLHQGDEVHQLEGRSVSQRAVDNHLKGRLGPLERVPLVLKPLDLVGKATGKGLVTLQVDAELAGLEGDVAAPGLVADDDAAAVADAGRVDVLVRVLGLHHGVDVLAPLVGEGTLSDVRLGRVGGDVGEFAHVLRGLQQPPEFVGREQRVAHFEL